MWNKTIAKPIGKTVIKVTNPKTQHVHDVKFIVVEIDFNCLLGLQTVRELNLITVNVGCFNAKIDTSTDLGDLETVSLTLYSDVKPRVLPSRKLPIALQSRVKNELDSLCYLGIISPINEPTQWVSQMAVVEKHNGELRICIDR